MVVSRTLAALRKQNVAKATFHPDGSLQSVEFIAPLAVVQAVEAKALSFRGSQREEKVKVVDGTDIPDDGSPLNPLDTILKTPSFNPWETQ